MLVIQRKVDECMVLGGRIRVVVVAVQGERVKLGFEAPPEVSVLREELLHKQDQDEQHPAP